MNTKRNPLSVYIHLHNYVGSGVGRMFRACSNFEQGLIEIYRDPSVFGHLSLWHIFGEQGPPAPDPERMATSIRRLTVTFLSDIFDTLTDVILRKGLHDDRAVVEFRSQCEGIKSVAYQNNWMWALDLLPHKLPLADTHWESVWFNTLEEKTSALKDIVAVSGRTTEQNTSDLPPESPLAKQRRMLLEEYKNATGNPSNSRIYKARNSGIHKPEFYKWRDGILPSDSATAMSFERFLRERKPPIPRK